MRTTTPEQLYADDLAAFLEALDAQDAEDARRAEQLIAQRRHAGKGGAKGGAARAKACPCSHALLVSASRLCYLVGDMSGQVPCCLPPPLTIAIACP